MPGLKISPRSSNKKSHSGGVNGKKMGKPDQKSISKLRNLRWIDSKGLYNNKDIHVYSQVSNKRT